jgi:hypothetical protein
MAEITNNGITGEIGMKESLGFMGTKRIGLAIFMVMMLAAMISKPRVFS